MKHISDKDLHELTREAASKEKSATLALLEFLREVHERKLYAKLGFSTLWEYVNKALGYSGPQTSERVNAMHLIAKVHGAELAVAEGELSLTSAAMLGRFMKNEKPSAEMLQELVTECSGKSTREVEKILIPLEVATKKESARAISNSLTRISFDADEDFMTLRNRARELAGQKGYEMKATFKLALQDLVNRREPKLRSESKLKPQHGPKNETSEQGLASVHAPEVKKSSASRYNPVAVKDSVRIRANDQCEEICKETGWRCSARMGLEFDHFPIPFALGGKSTLKNMRLVCRAHNQLFAERIYGEKKMKEKRIRH